MFYASNINDCNILGILFLAFIDERKQRSYKFVD